VDLTPVAIREGHTLADRLFGPGAAPLRYDTIGSTVFGTPELGTVGLTEKEALERFKKVDIFKTNFRPLKATVSGSSERTIMKLVVDGATQRIVGAHILGGEAAEMIQLVAVAMTMGATKADFDATVAVHPTAAEELVTMRSAHARFEDGMEIP
jgi:glutathione reductase (NADPH)